MQQARHTGSYRVICGREKGGVLETMPYVGGARRRSSKGAIYWDTWAVKRKEFHAPLPCRRARQEVLANIHKWAGCGREFQEPRPSWPCHTATYMVIHGRRKRAVSSRVANWWGKTRNSSICAVYRREMCSATTSYAIAYNRSLDYVILKLLL